MKRFIKRIVPNLAQKARSQAIEQAIRERRLTESLELLEQSAIEGELAIFAMQGLQGKCDG